MKQHAKIVAWGYLVEVLLAGLAQTLAILFCGGGKVAAFVVDTAGAWAAFTGVLLAAALAIWIVLFQVATTAFGEWLMWRGAMKVYSRAFAYAAIVYAVGTVLLIICMSIKSSEILAHLSFFALLLGVVNLMTMVKTTKELLDLQTEYKRQEKVLKKTQTAPPTEPGKK